MTFVTSKKRRDWSACKRVVKKTTQAAERSIQYWHTFATANMTGWLLTLYVLAACLSQQSGCQAAFSEAGKYFITGSSNVVRGSSYPLTVQILEAAGPVNISAFLERDGEVVNNGHTQRGYVRVTAVESKVMVAGSLNTLTINVPLDVYDAGHAVRMHVRGTGGLQMEETFRVNVAEKIASVFVQTDKVAYQPGDRVTFTTFALGDLDLTPYTGVFDVTLKNPSGKVMKKWHTQSAADVSTFQFDLDKYTFQGQWTIQTSSSDTGRSSTSFKVETRNSENQAFEVKVNLPKTMNSSMTLAGSFEASYPMGVRVKGTATVETTMGTMIMPFDGNATFQFPNIDLHSTSLVKVSVTEDDTGVTGSGQASVRVYERDVKLEFTEQTPSIFRPKLPFTAYVKISNNADEPLQIPADSIYRTVHVNGVGHYVRPAPANTHYSQRTFSGSYPILARKLTLPDSGRFSLDLDIPEDVSRVDLIVTFQGVQKKLTLHQVEHADGENYLQISLLGDMPKVTDTQSGDVRFRVLSTHALSDLSVEVMSRGQVVLAQKPTLTNKATSGDIFSAEFTVTLTWAMTPTTEVIVYHVVRSGHSIQEVVSDSIALNVQGLLENAVEVTSDRQHVAPGQEVVLHVRARPGSNVGVLVEEDKRPSGQVLTEHVISRMLEKNSHVPLESNQVLATSQQYPHASFYAAGITTIDGNGNIYNTGTSTIVRQTVDGTGNSANNETPNIAFLGTNTTRPDGTTTFTVILPDNVNTWSVTGFAFDSSGHVGVVNQPLKIEASYPVYGELLGPDHVVSGEHVVLTAYVHNSRDVQSQATVMLTPMQNVELLDVRQNGTFTYFSTSDMEHRQTVTVPAKSSQRVFFTVTSPPGTPKFTTNAYLSLSIDCGGSVQTIPYAYTVVPEGVEQRRTQTSLINVQGQLTQDISSVDPPSQALSVTTTRHVTVAGDFDDLVLPLALAEEDLLEVGTGPAALLHLALPVMMAKAHPELLDQLRAPIERGFQRLLNFVNGYNFEVFSGTTAVTSSSLHLAALQLLFEASQFIYVESHFITGELYAYFNTYSSSTVDLLSYRYHLDDHYGLQGSPSAHHMFAALLILELQNAYHGQSSFDHIYANVLRSLKRANDESSRSQDPLGLSYLALADVERGDEGEARSVLFTLLAQQDPGSANSDVLFWNTTTVSEHDLRMPPSRDILTAANALKMLLHTGQMPEADRVARWLLRQRKESGLFRDAMDTMAATEALLAHSAASKNNTSRLHVHSTRLHNEHGHGQLANITATGHGKVITQVDVNYYVTDETGDKPFEVVPVVLDESLNHFKLMICSRWLAADKTSGAVVQEVSVPSGFVVSSKQTFNSLTLNAISRNSTLLTVYFSQVGTDSTCYTLPVDRINPVAHSPPGLHHYQELPNTGKHGHCGLPPSPPEGEHGLRLVPQVFLLLLLMFIGSSRLHGAISRPLCPKCCG